VLRHHISLTQVAWRIEILTESNCYSSFGLTLTSHATSSRVMLVLSMPTININREYQSDATKSKAIAQCASETDQIFNWSYLSMPATCYK